MATYAELFDLRNNSELTNKITTAVIIAAEGIRTATAAPALRTAWAKAAFEDPSREAKRMLMAVLAAHKDMTVAQITGATDAEIQTAVDAAVEVFAGA